MRDKTLSRVINSRTGKTDAEFYGNLIPAASGHVEDSGIILHSARYFLAARFLLILGGKVSYRSFSMACQYLCFNNARNATDAADFIYLFRPVFYLRDRMGQVRRRIGRFNCELCGLLQRNIPRRYKLNGKRPIRSGRSPWADASADHAKNNTASGHKALYPGHRQRCN